MGKKKSRRSRSGQRPVLLSPPKDKHTFWAPAHDDLDDDDMVYEGGPLQLRKPQPKDRGNRPAAEPPSPAHPAGNGEEAHHPPSPAHPAGSGAEAAAALSPTHSVGEEQAKISRPSQKYHPRFQPSSSSNSSASSPSDSGSNSDSDSSATSPSSSESDAEPASERQPKKFKVPDLLVRGSTPPVSPNYEKPYSTRRDSDLEKETTAQTLHELRAEANKRYLESFPNWDRKKDGTPPQAFTKAWYRSDACQPFVTWYHDREPIVMARQAAALRAQQAADNQSAPPPGEERMEVDPPNNGDSENPTAQIELDEREFDLGEEEEPDKNIPVTAQEVDELLNEFQFGETPPAPSTVPSQKPAKTQAPQSGPTHPVGKPKPPRTETTHSVVPDPGTIRKEKPKKKTVASVKRREAAPATSSSRSSSKRSREQSSGSRHPPAKDARHAKRTPSRSPSPNMKRHQDRVSKAKAEKRRSLVPVIDGYVGKDLAVYVSLHGHKQQTWVQRYSDPQKPYELLGLIAHIGVPASYLPVKYCNPVPAGTKTPMADQTYDQLFVERTIIPWDFILGCNLGALPTYWRHVTDDTRAHLYRALDNASKYRDINVLGVGPVDFDLRQVEPTDIKEYKEHRQNMVTFARIARNTRRSLTIMLNYEKEPVHTTSVHADAIATLRESGLPTRHRIHLIANNVSAFELLMWLEMFPNTLISFDLELLGSIRLRMGQKDPDPTDEEYLNAYAMKDFLTYMPLESIALHSGCPEPQGPVTRGRHSSPTDLLGAATEFQYLTGTLADTLHANNAKNLVHFYHLDRRLLDYSVDRWDYRDAKIGTRDTLDAFSTRIRSLFGVGPRAAQAEQEKPDRRASIAEAAPAEAMDTSNARTSSSKKQRSSSSVTGHRRQRSPSSDDHHRRRGRSPAKRPSPLKRRDADKTPASLRDSRPQPPHPGERKRSETLSTSQSRSRSTRRSRTPSSDLYHRRSPPPTKFVVTLDKPPTYVLADAAEQKPKPIRLCDLKLPPRDSPPPDHYLLGSRLSGRVSRGGKILPTLPTVRDRIQALKSLKENDPQLSVRERVKELRLQQRQKPAHSAEADQPEEEQTTTAYAPDPRLLKADPVFRTEMFPVDMDAEEIYQEALQLFEGEPDENTGLRSAPSKNLASVTPVPAQPELFQVPRQPGPDPCPFDPFHECNGAGEDQTVFHLPLKVVQLVTSRRWKYQHGIRGSDTYKALLEEIKKLRVRSLAQMTLLKYIDRLRGNDEERTPNALRFLYKVLTAQDLSRRLPYLLRKYQPLIVDEDTENPWPTRKDFRHALEHRSCYCCHAAVYIFEHLSGPIVFNPDWFLGDDSAAEVRESLVSQVIDDRNNTISRVRHQVYRQYGHAHIQAIQSQLPEFDWIRFDDSKKSKVPLGIPLTQHTIVFVDRYIWDTYGQNLKVGVEMVLIENTTRDAIIKEVRRYFPHSTTERVVFWLGPDYFLNGNEGYAFVVASLCYHYTRYFGSVEQYVVLPTYVRLCRVKWSHSALATYIQRTAIMPHARVVLGPLDLMLWERDERELAANNELEQWDSEDLDEDGRYLSDDLIQATKQNMAHRHQLDLWKTDEAHSETTTVETTSTTEPSTSDNRHMSSASGSRSTEPSRDPQLPTTSSGTHPVPGADARNFLADLAQRLPHKGTTREEQEILTSTAKFVSDSVMSLATELALQAAKPRLDSITKQLGQSQHPPKKSDDPKDSSGSRKDQNRGSRK